MTGNRLTVIVPTRTQEKQSFFLQRSIRSIRQQQLTGQFEVNIVVAVDKGDMLDPQLSESLGVQCIESHGKSQAAALNGAIRQLDCDYVAFLEDDDRWQPQFLAIAAQALELGGFVSSNQTLIDDEGDIVRFLDFPTPSGWIMHYNTMARVGEFNESFRYHIDNEWLALGEHARLHPEIGYTASQEMVTTTVDRVIAGLQLAALPNVMVIDTQGADLKVLRGAVQTLAQVDAIFVEISEEPLYEGGCTHEEITAFLRPLGFRMRWMELNQFRWGDAFYCRPHGG